MKAHLDWVAKWADYSPDKIALTEMETGRSLTFRQWNHIGNRLAAQWTREFGLCPGARVAVLSETRLEYLMLLSAALKTGAILVPLNYRLVSREIDYLLGDSQPRLILYQEQFAATLAACPHFEKIAHRLPLEPWGEAAFSHREEPAPPFPTTDIDENNPLFILYTSGTTGFPKGAIYTHKMMFWNSINTAMRLGLTGEDRTLNVMPFFHTGGWNVLQTPFLHRGAWVGLVRKFDAAAVLDMLAAERVTLFMGVPTMLKMMAGAPNFARADLPSLRFFIVGGEAMPLPLIETWQQKGIPIRQGYGLTEFGPNVTSLHQDDAVRKMGSIGKPNFYVETRIVDEAGRPVPPDTIGEFCLRGPVCTPGYWNNPTATAEVLREGWFHTGDYVRQDSEGYLYVVDRKKNMYISGGENVYPAEVEKFLHTHPGIAEAVVIGVPDEKWGEAGKAFVVPSPGYDLSPEAVLEFCRGKLAKYKIPKYVEIVAALPRGDTGKIDRKRLKQPKGER